jgi:hypothetical protein
MPDPAYQRLGSRARNLGGVFSLWLGDGHLLQVTATLGVEAYRRWYLNEIQAMIFRYTNKRTVWNLIWGILCGLSLAAVGGFIGLASASGNEREAQIALDVSAGIAGAFAAVCAGMLLWNSLMGPTCTVFLQTPTGLIPLAAPTRRRAAEALLARLRPLIEAAQSETRLPPA